MTAQSQPSDDDDAYSTQDFILEARRPLLVERHRKLIEEMEAGLSDAFITGQIDHPRLQAMLRDLEADSERRRILATMQTVAADEHYRDATLRNALVEQLCLLREQSGIEVAALQLHVIGVYRSVRSLISQHQDEAPGLAELRELPAAVLGRLLNPIETGFGSPNLGEALIYTPVFADRCLRTIRRIHRAENGDAHWEEAAGEPPLSREVEEPLSTLSESELRATRQLLIRDRIRSQFFRDVFLLYLNRNEFDPSEGEAHRTVLHWLQAIEATAHLYPFMQGQTTGQKAWRLSRLLEKIVQLHEIYARVALARQHPTYQERFAAITTRECLAIMVRDHYPALAMTPQLSLAALLCPFSAFVAFVQDKVDGKDFVLPPDSRRA